MKPYTIGSCATGLWGLCNSRSGSRGNRSWSSPYSCLCTSIRHWPFLGMHKPCALHQGLEGYLVEHHCPCPSSPHAPNTFIRSHRSHKRYQISWNGRLLQEWCGSSPGWTWHIWGRAGVHSNSIRVNHWSFQSQSYRLSPSALWLFDSERLTEYPHNNITQLPTSQYYIFCILACEFYFDHPMVYER